MNLRLFILLFCIGFSETYGQSTTQALEAGQDVNVLFRNEAIYKFFAHSRGFGLGYRRGKHVTGKIKRLVEIEGLTLKHPKEIKVTGTTDQNKRFIYGKLNNVGMIRGTFGFQNVLFSRSDKKSIEIRCSYLVGGVIALTKPYYVTVYRVTGGKRFEQSVKYNSDILTQDSVVGRGPFIDGLNEVKFFPGATAKFNISFEYAAVTQWIRAIETGISADYFPKALQIMAKNEPENFIFTFYLGFVFGKKWF